MNLASTATNKAQAKRVEDQVGPIPYLWPDKPRMPFKFVAIWRESRKQSPLGSDTTIDEKLVTTR